MGDRAAKVRLDALAVERGLAETRARAQAIIQGGGVTADGEVLTKPSALVPEDTELALVRQPLPYVSRGGLKLEHALDQFQLDVRAKVAVDIGASTGGFTDVLLQEGASKVYAIDVGYGQLDWKLRHDPRVVAMERTNIRDVGSLPEPSDLAVIDVSFISLRQVLPHAQKLLNPAGDAIALIKPQFEAGRQQVKKGVVRSSVIWSQVLHDVLGWAITNRWTVLGLERSPIRGPAGNVEFLAHLRLDGEESGIDIDQAVQRVIATD